MSSPRDDESSSKEDPPDDGGRAAVDESDATTRTGTDDAPDPEAPSTEVSDSGRDTVVTDTTSDGRGVERADAGDRPADGVAADATGATESVDRPPVRGDETAEESGQPLRTFVVDVASSALAVLLVGALLFAVSGVWPPMVAIESPSMTPHMKTGDLVFVMEEERFPGDGAVAGTGVVTLHSGAESGYSMFRMPGDVIVYKPDGSESATPIIHRAMFYVEDGENWYDEADRGALGNAEDCDALNNCPAPHAGFITKGDANGVYDQVRGLSTPVKPRWVVGTAELRIPKLGCIRLRQNGCLGGARAGTLRVAGTDRYPAGNRTAGFSAGNRTAVPP